MKFHLSYILFLSMFLISCNDNAERREAENLKNAQKNELVFERINKGWTFSRVSLSPSVQTIVGNWKEWRLFLNELNLKPKSSIGAFQKKAKILAKRVADLNMNIPLAFNKPEIRSRIAVLSTKINSINLFLNIDDIADQKVVVLVGEVNVALASLTQQMEEIVRKSNIPKEEGEADLIQMMDASRAIPTVKPDNNLPQN